MIKNSKIFVQFSNRISYNLFCARYNPKFQFSTSKNGEDGTSETNDQDSDQKNSRSNSTDSQSSQQLPNNIPDINAFSSDISKLADILLPESMKNSASYSITKGLATKMMKELEKNSDTSKIPGGMDAINAALKTTLDALSTVQTDNPKQKTTPNSNPDTSRKSKSQKQTGGIDSEESVEIIDPLQSKDHNVENVREPQVFEPDLITSPNQEKEYVHGSSLDNTDNTEKPPFEDPDNTDQKSKRGYTSMYSDTEDIDNFLEEVMTPSGKRKSNHRGTSEFFGTPNATSEFEISGTDTELSDDDNTDNHNTETEESDVETWHGRYKTLAEQKHSLLESLRPQDIVNSLSKYIVGQEEAKKMVAVALRNRWRRHLLPADIQKEVMPKNILMLGPTGSGKTEIARRLANLAGAPFIITQATTLTEVGYHGRDVDMIIRDLVEVGMHLAKVNLAQEAVKPGTKAHYKVGSHLINALLKSTHFSREVPLEADATSTTDSSIDAQSDSDQVFQENVKQEPSVDADTEDTEAIKTKQTRRLSRKEIRSFLNDGIYDDVLINVYDFPQDIIAYTKKYEEFGPTSQTGPDMFNTSSHGPGMGSGMGFDPLNMGMNSIIFPISGSGSNKSGESPLGDLIRSISGGQSYRQKHSKTSSKKRKQVVEKTVHEMRAIVEEFVGEKSLDPTRIKQEALRSVEQDGIVFLDELDKICEPRKGSSNRGADPSSEGVQRDLLPLIEGSTVSTRYGNVKTHHILFIGAGAFHSTSPSDLLPELQGRLPCRVELKALSKDDLERILTDTENSLIKQNIALFATEGVDLKFSDEAIREIAVVSAEINSTVEDIGARRLITVIERLLEDHSFHASEKKGETVEITVEDVRDTIGRTVLKTDLSRFII